MEEELGDLVTRYLDRTECDLSCQMICDDEFIEKVSPYLETTNWRSLLLSENNLTNIIMKEFEFVLSMRNSLEELDLGSNQISDDGLIELCKFIPKSSLIVLTLNSNEITDIGFNQLIRVLPMSNLQSVDLCENQITDASVFRLANVLESSTLSTLDLSENDITDEGARLLAVAMRRSCLTLLNLQGTHLSAPVLKEIENIESLVRYELKIMIALCSVKFIDRIGAQSKLRLLPIDLYRRIALSLYKFHDFKT